jgi:hypothetical protein
MEYFIAFMIGWCGTYWPRRFPIPIGPGPRDPDDPWPPNCPVCGPIIGGIAAVVLEATIGREVGTGLIEDGVLSFFAGAFGSTLVGGLLSLGKRGPAANG